MAERKQPNSFIRYGNIAFQMAATIALGAWGGKKLDEHYNNSKPVFTIVLSLVGIAAGMYLALKDLIKPPKK